MSLEQVRAHLNIDNSSCRGSINPGRRTRTIDETSRKAPDCHFDWPLLDPAPFRLHASLKARMGWEMPWFTITDGVDADFGVDAWHGMNVFYRDGDRVFRTYFITTAATSRWGAPGTTSTSHRWAGIPAASFGVGKVQVVGVEMSGHQEVCGASHEIGDEPDAIHRLLLCHKPG
jgi:hypothetical protein